MGHVDGTQSFLNFEWVAWYTVSVKRDQRFGDGVSQGKGKLPSPSVSLLVGQMRKAKVKPA
jgi:hypothetical protein